LSSAAAWLGAVLRRAFARIDYFALYEARVVSQRADGSVDVWPFDARLPPMGGIPLRLGIPGAHVKLAPSCRVLVGFANGSPGEPFALLLDAGDVVSVSFGGLGGRPVARVGDPVESETIPPGAITFLSPTVQVTNTQPVTLRGPILLGSQKVKAA